MGSPLSRGGCHCIVTESEVAEAAAGAAGWSGTDAWVEKETALLHTDSPISFTACGTPEAHSISASGSWLNGTSGAVRCRKGKCATSH